MLLMRVLYPLSQLEILLLEILVFRAELFDAGEQLFPVCDVADVRLHLEVVLFLQLFQLFFQGLCFFEKEGVFSCLVDYVLFVRVFEHLWPLPLFAFQELWLVLQAIADVFDWGYAEVLALPCRLLQLDCLFEPQMVHLPLDSAQLHHSLLQQVYLPLLGPYLVIVFVDDSVDVGHEVLLEPGGSLHFLACQPPHLCIARARVLPRLFLLFLFATLSAFLLAFSEVDGSASAVLVDRGLQFCVLPLERQYFLMMRMHVHLLVPHDEALYLRPYFLQNPLLRLPMLRLCRPSSLRTRVLVFLPFTAVELDPYVFCFLLWLWGWYAGKDEDSFFGIGCVRGRSKAVRALLHVYAAFADSGLVCLRVGLKVLHFGGSAEACAVDKGSHYNYYLPN